MKRYFNLLLLTLLILTQTTWSAAFKDSVTYQGRELIKKYEESAMAEYIPQKESLDNWSEMFAVRLHMNPSSPKEAIEHLEKNLEVLKSSGKDSYARVIESYSSPEEGIHFIVLTLSEGDIFEYNVFRYIEIEPDKLISFQLAKRYYRSWEFTEEEAKKVVEWTMKQIDGSREDVMFLFDEKLAGQVFGS